MTILCRGRLSLRAFNFNRFNQVAEHANRLNSLIDTSTETVIEYREILRREKTCLICLFLLTLLVGCSNTRTVYVPAPCTPIPMDLTQPMIVPLPPNSMTACRAVLWIKPLLAVIEKQ